VIAGLLANVIDLRADRAIGIMGKKQLAEDEQVHLSDVKEFKLVMWLLSLNCVVIYICVMVFNGIASNFYQKRFGFSTVMAGMVIAITYGISAVCTPFIGFSVDKYGKRTYLIVCSSVLCLIPHIVLAALPNCDGCIDGIFMLIFLGIGYSIYASVIWAAIPYVVEEKTIGTAYGVTTAIQNMGLFAAPLIVGAIADGTTMKHGYFWVSIFFVACATVGVITGVNIFFLNNRQDLKLNLPQKDFVEEQEEDDTHEQFLPDAKNDSARRSQARKSFGH
jgi:MFS family permease